jgi:hypothetical protein
MPTRRYAEESRIARWPEEFIHIRTILRADPWPQPPSMASVSPSERWLA